LKSQNPDLCVDKQYGCNGQYTTPDGCPFGFFSRIIQQNNNAGTGTRKLNVLALRAPGFDAAEKL